MRFLEYLTKMDIRNVLAIMVILLSFCFLFLLALHKVPIENKDLVNISTGFVIGASVGAIIGYYFTSSKDKNQLPDNSNKQP